MNDILIIFSSSPFKSVLTWERKISQDGFLTVYSQKPLKTFKNTNEGILLRIDTASAGHNIEVNYNLNVRKLKITRSRVGVPAIYYCKIGNYNLVSTSLSKLSTVTSLLKGNMPDIDKQALGLYLAFQYVPAPWTIWNGIHQLDANMFLEVGIDNGNFRIHKENIEIQSDSDQHFDNVGKDALELCEKAMRRGIENSKSIAALLSGGMDTSTNIAIISRKLGIKPTVYTASFSEKGFDESHFAEIVATYFDLDHKIIQINPDSHTLPTIAQKFDSPHGDRAIFAQDFLFTAIASAGHDSIITGEGGDEIMGYPRIREGGEDLSWLTYDPESLAAIYLEKTCLSQSKWRDAFYHDLEIDLELPVRFLENVHSQFLNYEPFERLYFGQWQTWMIHGVYVKDTRLARGSGLRAVLPFMNGPLMNKMMGVPFDLKLEGLRNKNFLKRALKGILPDETLTKKKQKFWLPFEKWFREIWRDFLHDALFTGNGFVTNFINPITIRRLIEDHDQGTDNSRILWSLLFMELWGKGIHK